LLPPHPPRKKHHNNNSKHNKLVLFRLRATFPLG